MALLRAGRSLSLPKMVPQISSIRLSSDSGQVPGLGRGAGKGGGGGGSIRTAGGAFGELEAAKEEEYFYKLQKQQLKGLRNHLDREVEFHNRHIKHHQEAIERHKKRMAELHHEENELEPSKK